MEKRAKEIQPVVNINSLPTRLYLEETTIPIIYEALKALAKERPVNPVEFFSYYLLTHNTPTTNKWVYIIYNLEMYVKIYKKKCINYIKIINFFGKILLLKHVLVFFLRIS